MSLDQGEFIVGGRSYTFVPSPVPDLLGQILDEEGEHTGLYAPSQETASFMMIAYRRGLRDGERVGASRLSFQLRSLLGAAAQTEQGEG